MKYSIIKSTSDKTIKWSGGCTTELFIHPPTAQYQQRNFDFRLSTATVEVDASVFTPLVGVSRTLMVLEGQMTLSHKDQHQKALSKFEQDKFEGGWETASKGQCVDFNLMTLGKTKGTLLGLELSENQMEQLTIPASTNQLFIFVYSGQIEIHLAGASNALSKGDVLHVNDVDISTIEIRGKNKSELVVCQIRG